MPFSPLPLGRAAIFSSIAASFLLGCPDAGGKVDTLDSGNIACDRIHGATGVLMFEDGGDTFHFPTSPPDEANVTTSVAGPLSDGTSWGAFFGGRWLVSADAGCNWEDEGGKLPSTANWKIVPGGSTVYAFDRDSSAGGFSVDDGMSWTATDASEPFFGVPVVDPTTPGRLRGVQARGVVTSDDDGQNWDVSGLPPDGAILAAAVWEGGIDTIVAVTSSGVYETVTGGGSWTSITGSLANESFVASNIAIHPDGADAIWVSGSDDDGPSIWRTGDAGASWKAVALQRQVDLDDGAPLYPVPGNTDQVLSSWATTEGDYGINVYRIDSDGIHTVHVSSYWDVTDIGFREDGAWIVSVSGVK